MEGRDLFAEELNVGIDLFAEAAPQGRDLFAEPVDLFGEEKEAAYVPTEHSVLGTVAEYARAGNTAVMEAADFLSVGTVNAALRLAGIDGQLPTFLGGYESAEDIAYGTEGQDTQRQFMPDGTARDIVQAAGVTTSIAPGLMSVKRASTVGNTALDLLGFGQSVSDDVMRDLSRQGVKIARARGKDWNALGDDILGSDDAIWDAAQASAKRDVIEKNRVFMDEWDEGWEKVAKEQGKTVEEMSNWNGPIVTEHTIPASDIKPSLTNVLNEMQEIWDIAPDKVLKVLKKKGGLKVDSDPIRLAESVDKQFSQEANMLEDHVTTWWERATAPMTETLRRHVGSNVAAPWERAVETATRKSARVAADIGEPISGVAKLAEEVPELKAALLDLHHNPLRKMKEAREIVQSYMGDEGLKSFDTFFKHANEQAGSARKFLYKPNSGFDDIYYLHAAKKAKKGGSGIRKVADAHTVKPGALQDRSRKLASEMEPEELASYGNPILTHLKHMSDEEHLIEVARKFHLRPSMGKGGSTQDLFKAVEKKLTTDGIEPLRAEAAKDLMHSAHLGSTKIPPPAVRAFMSLGYAGTLAQFKSAMLNLHDVFVSMHKIGVKPTMKALMQTTDGQFGKTLKEMGIGSDQSVGEFVRTFDDTIQDPSKMDHLAHGASRFTEGAFKYSGFAMMDRIGKGVVLRSAVNAARDAAKRGDLMSEWGKVLEPNELRKVRKAFRAGTKIEDMSPNVRRLVEEAAFSKLGEQQLISMAGRPLAYANETWARPLYAMTGFAIKQRAMFRANVYEAIQRGNVGQAAYWTAKYALFAGMGYGLIDETRTSVFKGEEFKPEDILFGVVEQMSSVASLNRVGDMYSFSKIAEDPVMFLLESVLPPMGLTGAAAKTAVKSIVTGKVEDELFRKFPVLGDFYNYYWNPRDGKEARDAQGKWDEVGDYWDDEVWADE